MHFVDLRRIVWILLGSILKYNESTRIESWIVFDSLFGTDRRCQVRRRCLYLSWQITNAWTHFSFGVLSRIDDVVIDKVVWFVGEASWIAGAIKTSWSGWQNWVIHRDTHIRRI